MVAVVKSRYGPYGHRGAAANCSQATTFIGLDRMVGRSIRVYSIQIHVSASYLQPHLANRDHNPGCSQRSRERSLPRKLRSRKQNGNNPEVTLPVQEALQEFAVARFRCIGCWLHLTLVAPKAQRNADITYEGQRRPI